MNERQSLGFDPLVISEEVFNTLYELPIGEFIEQRGHGSFQASYLSWVHAIRLLKPHLPEVYADLEVDENGGVVFQHFDGQFYVRPFLTNGSQRTPALMYPVMDKMFRGHESASVRDISDSIQRGTVKAIATFTGLGLKCYCGEDIPKGDSISAETKAIIDSADRVEELEPAKKKPKKAPKPSPKATPAGNDWNQARVPFGKNKDKQLGELSEMSAKWYFENYEVNTKFDDSIAFKAALDQMGSDLGYTEDEDIDELDMTARDNDTDASQDVEDKQTDAMNPDEEPF